MKRLFVISGKERGFTLAEVIVAMVIISFVVLSTWRVITSSLHSITRQDQKVKALHISQAHLARLEAETFSRVVPENCKIPQWREGEDEKYEYTLSIYDEDIPYDTILIVQDDDYWYDTEGLGFEDTDLRKDDGLLVADRDGTPYRWTSASLPLPGEFYWDPGKMQLHFLRDPDEEKEVQIYYRYYHLIDEGATIPSSDGEAREKGVIRLVTDPGELNGHAKNIAVEEIKSRERIDPNGYSSNTRKLFFDDDDEGKSVWIYYLPDSDTNSSGPDGVPDDYLDPTENSIVGVVAGNFWDLDKMIDTPQVTKTKKITLTEYWRQAGQIQKAEQKAYIVDR